MVTFNIGLLYQDQNAGIWKKRDYKIKRKEIISIFLYKRNTDNSVIEIWEQYIDKYGCLL